MHVCGAACACGQAVVPIQAAQATLLENVTDDAIGPLHVT